MAKFSFVNTPTFLQRRRLHIGAGPVRGKPKM